VSRLALLAPFAAAAGVVGAAAVAAPAARASAYPDHVPPGYTGGFGEPTCAQCHTGTAPNAGGGSLELEGLPRRYEPGEAYRLTIVLRDGELARGGFQLAARFAEGKRRGAQAGGLRSVSSRAEIVVDSASGVRYGRHTLRGTADRQPEATRWTLEWTAPREGGTVSFDAAANASNYDDSALGDHVYTLHAVASPQNRK
jgi:hypothetical protein